MKTREELQTAMDEITEKHKDSIEESKKSHDDYAEKYPFPGIGPFSDLTGHHKEWLEKNLEGDQLKELDKYLEARSKFGWVISQAINWICDKVAPKTTLDILKEDGLI